MVNVTAAIPNITQLLSFSWLDYTFFFSLLGVSVLIGIYFGCFGTRQDTTDEYLLGSRKMGIFPIAVSLTASHLSGITLLGIPSEIYVYGTQFWACNFTIIIVALIVIYVYLPVFYVLKVNSSYEYLKLRFDDRIRIVAMGLYVIANVLHIPLVIYVPALAFNQVSGIAVHKITPIICAICIFYTTIGGLKAVVWTDTIQFIVTLCAMFTVLVMGTVNSGGVAEIWKTSDEGHRIEFFNMDVDPTVRTTFWGILIGLSFYWVANYGINPSSIQRFMSVPNFTKGKQAVVLFILGILITKAISCFSGLIMYARYKDCDPLTSGKIKRLDQLLPFYVLDVARNIPGLPGLFVSGVFSTALSTMSAHLNTLAGVLYEDFFYKYIPKNAPDSTANRIVKTTVVVTGIICVALVFLVEHLGGVLQISASFSAVTTGPLLGLFTLGMLFPSATSKGALYGGVSGLATVASIVTGFQYHYMRGHTKYAYLPLSTQNCDNSTLSLLANHTTPLTSSLTSPNQVPFILFRLSFYWNHVIGCVVTLVVGLLVSWLCSDENKHKYNKEFYSPVIHRWVPKNANEEEIDVPIKVHRNHFNLEGIEK